MPGVSKEQIAAAKRMTAIEFLRRFRPNELVKSGSRGEFQLREHDSFKINGESSIWHWKSRDIGGKSALDYLIKVEGMKFVDAVLALCDECPGYIPPSPQPKKRPEFILPPAAANNRRVFAYLLKRGISRGVIEACVRAGILYPSLQADPKRCVVRSGFLLGRGGFSRKYGVVADHCAAAIPRPGPTERSGTGAVPHPAGLH